MQIKLQDGRLDVAELQASAFGGTVTANLSLDARTTRRPALALHAQMKGMDLGALLAAAGAKREVRGGKTDVRIDIGATGSTPRQWDKHDERHRDQRWSARRRWLIPRSIAIRR